MTLLLFRTARRLATAVAVVAASLLPATAAAVTTGELVELRRAGLGDEVLIALIESTGVPSPVDADEAIRLKQAGLSDAVIAAAVRASTPQPDPAASDADPAPNVAVIGAAPEPPAVIEREVVYIPWLVPVPKRPVSPRPAKPYLDGDRGFGRFINDGTALPPPETVRDRRK
ncbi:MAG TPA: hypothetical protein VF198_01175 [Vicinamibacterales bacterium]